MAVVFHGSSINFPCPKRCYSTRSSRDADGIERVKWSGAAVFATPDRRIALQYTANHVENSEYTTGVDLINEISENAPLSILVIGGKNQQDALNKLYGIRNDASEIGYIYHMNADHFYWEKGLGKMECISMKPNQPGFLIRKEVVKRRTELDDYIKQGLIKINWAPSVEAHRKQAAEKSMLTAYLRKCSEKPVAVAAFVMSQCTIL